MASAPGPPIFFGYPGIQVSMPPDVHHSRLESPKKNTPPKFFNRFCSQTLARPFFGGVHVSRCPCSKKDSFFHVFFTGILMGFSTPHTVWFFPNSLVQPNQPIATDPIITQNSRKSDFSKTPHTVCFSPTR